MPSMSSNRLAEQHSSNAKKETLPEPTIWGVINAIGERLIAFNANVDETNDDDEDGEVL